ncbi:MAG TPA: prepilin-type N-terminal cleavage/methylation domain-containing protein [Vicinamibacteria bacterium]|nr:prepilin-type N-terminal cleavage/methylation domain-containing protein [Vicinamibacteria bacterium]
MRHPSPDRRPEHGFSLVELLVVAGIIAVMAAVAIPSIGQYIRNYKIRGAAQQVADQIQTARSKAIMKNVQLGVLWMPTSSAGATITTSTWAIEDDLQPQVSPAWFTVATENLTTLLADRAQSPGSIALPDSIQFDSPANCPGGAAANVWGIRFNSLGGTCQIGTSNCPTPGTPPTYTSSKRISFASGTGMATICLLDTRTNLRRTVIVTPGGRVLIQ